MDLLLSCTFSQFNSLMIICYFLSKYTLYTHRINIELIFKLSVICFEYCLSGNISITSVVSTRIVLLARFLQKQLQLLEIQ